MLRRTDVLKLNMEIGWAKNGVDILRNKMKTIVTAFHILNGAHTTVAALLGEFRILVAGVPFLSILENI